MRILNKRFRLTFAHLLPLISACLFSNCTENVSNALPEKLIFGKVQTIRCNNDTTHSYCLYVPSTYNNRKHWPLIFLFDPHGNGTLGVDKFKEVAERYGYILAGSNNSRNGAEGIEEIISKLATDVFSKYPIDKQRIYAAGFSGGGRVALTMALVMKNVKGVMIAGAGESQVDFSSLVHKFDIYATAGLGDFNYLEVTSMKQQLLGSGLRFLVSEFDGGHAWPPKYVINEAVQWFTLNAMRDKVLVADDEVVDKIVAEKRLQIDSLMKANHLIAAGQTVNNTIMFVKHLTSTTKLERLSKRIRETPEYKAEQELRSQSFLVEKEWKQGLLNSFTSQDTSWWRKQVTALHQRINNSGEIYSRQMFMRVKGFLGIVAYTFTNDVIVRNELSQAERLIAIYQIIEPDNADALFFKAIMLDRQNKPFEALRCMKKAREMGFSDWKKFNDMASAKLQEGISGN